MNKTLLVLIAVLMFTGSAVALEGNASAGKAKTASCAACHGADGKGLESLGPPLVRSEWVNGSQERLSAILLQGLMGPIEVGGKKYTQAAAMQGVKMSAGHSQYALPLGYFYITGLWIHCISGNDVMNGKTALWTLLDDWHPECELATKRRPQDTHALPDSVFQ